jgi:pyruvate formate lyase activating enzyme
MMAATIFNIQRFSLHDGPGIRTTVFLKGCPLSCSWCHNPESMDAQPEPSVASVRCLTCHSCEPVCSLGLARPGGIGAEGMDGAALCVRCGQCVAACPTGARQILGQTYDVDELMEAVNRDRLYQEESHGGVTFSGGEPLAAGNAPFVLDCLGRLAAAGVHTAVDTCGHVRPEVLKDAARLADLFLFDLKIMDPAAHRQATGQDNQLIHRNLTWLLKQGNQVQVRVPLIPGLTDSRGNLEAMAAFLKDLADTGDPPPVHLLPYHGIAGEKYQRLGRINPLGELRPRSSEEIQICAGWLEAHGLDVHIGG